MTAMRRAGLGLCLFLIVQATWGQSSYTLTGTVTDTRGQVLPGAAVLVKDHVRLGVTTDSQGEFTLEFPSAGPWVVTASFVGHASETT
ncbi:MAG: carboxypeptidase-like regulatory domain-containing protein, partial [Flavobacteriales bacterium]